MNFGVQLYRNVERPSTAADTQIRVVVALLFPK